MTMAMTNSPEQQIENKDLAAEVTEANAAEVADAVDNDALEWLDEKIIGQRILLSDEVLNNKDIPITINIPWNIKFQISDETYMRAEKTIDTNFKNNPKLEEKIVVGSDRYEIVKTEIKDANNKIIGIELSMPNLVKQISGLDWKALTDIQDTINISMSMPLSLKDRVTHYNPKNPINTDGSKTASASF